MICFPHAKINLGLQVIKKREDGYHDIETVFYPLNWRDILEIVEDRSSSVKVKVSFSSSGLAIYGNIEDNLIVKAYQLLDDDFNLPPVKIHLHKVIPMGAGLGGGSSDAAFTIKTLNELFNLQLSLRSQLEYARRLGSDCAFFIEGKPVLATGKGDLFEDINLNLSQLNLMVIWPEIHSNTADAYSGIAPSPALISLRETLNNDLNFWRDYLKNDFESTVFKKYPLLEKIKFTLYEQGARYVSMSGSGSAIFGLFDVPIPKFNWPKNYLVYLPGSDYR